MQPDQPHALYRFFGREDELLYIGITHDLPARLAAHRQEKPWWSEISRIGVEQYSSRQDALEAEKRAIIAEQPRWNVVHNQRPVALEHDPAVPGGRIRWVCGACECETWWGGVLYVSLHEVTEVQQMLRQTEQLREQGPALLSDAWLLETTRRAEWNVRCNGCYDPGETHYEIDLRLCRSLAALIKWTAHLHRKQWFEATNWIAFIHEVAQMTGSTAEPVGVH